MSLRFLVRAIPKLLVFAALVGAAWLGHRNGWTLPKFSALRGDPPNADADWCEEHSVPESMCVECDESLLPRPKAHGWCQAHGVPECPLCHPELAQLETPYYVTEADRQRTVRALASARPENGKNCKLYRRRIQFVSTEAFNKSGVDIDVASPSAIQETIRVYGEITYDPSWVAHLSTRSAGSVAKVYKQLGDHVEEEDILALVDSAGVGKAKEEFLQASKQLDARRKTHDSMISNAAVPDVLFRQAEAALSEAKIRFLSARQSLINLGLPHSPEELQSLSAEAVKDVPETELAKRLHFLGIPSYVRQGLDRQMHSSNLLPLRASMHGVIAARNIVPGEVIDTTKTLFEIVDTARVWLVLEVRSDDVEKLTVRKTKVIFKPDSQNRAIDGTITWIDTQADAKTRTVKVRTELANEDGKLRANTFGSGKIVLRQEPDAVVVPSSAVHWEGDCHVVFVRDKNWLKVGSYKVFHTRVVRLGMRDETNTEIIAGVLPGEVVATKGSEVLRAELLRGNFGEGCGCCKK